MIQVDWSWGPKFSAAEFRCKDSGEIAMDADFMDKLLALRKHLDFPFIITSGYRSPEYNAKISSTGLDGPHTTGKAADILVSGKRTFALVAAAPLYGFTGIGIKQRGEHTKRFIHLDTLEGQLRPWVWSY